MFRIALPNSPNGAEQIVWRLPLAAPPERVFAAWVEPTDHVHYWCQRSEPLTSGYRLHFIDGTVESCAIEESRSPSHVAFRYFGSRVDIQIQSLDGGTDLTLTARDVPLDEWHEVYVGWLNVLLPFKAWVDLESTCGITTRAGRGVNVTSTSDMWPAQCAKCMRGCERVSASPPVDAYTFESVFGK